MDIVSTVFGFLFIALATITVSGAGFIIFGVYGVFWGEDRAAKFLAAIILFVGAGWMTSYGYGLIGWTLQKYL